MSVLAYSTPYIDFIKRPDGKLRNPIARWFDYQFTTGDASGGNVYLIYNIAALAGQLGGDCAFDIRLFSPNADSAAYTYGRLCVTSFEPLHNLSGWGPEWSFALNGVMSMTYHLPIGFMFSLRGTPVTGTGGVQILLGPNTNGIACGATVAGFIYDMRLLEHEQLGA